MPTMTKTIEIEVEIEYIAEQGEPQTMWHPGSPAYLEITHVRAGLVDIIANISESTLEDLANEMSDDFDYSDDGTEGGYDKWREDSELLDNELSEEPG